MLKKDLKTLSETQAGSLGAASKLVLGGCISSFSGGFILFGLPFRGAFSFGRRDFARWTVIWLSQGDTVEGRLEFGQVESEGIEHGWGHVLAAAIADDFFVVGCEEDVGCEFVGFGALIEAVVGGDINLGFSGQSELFDFVHDFAGPEVV